jgi:hypothetical protein
MQTVDNERTFAIKMKGERNGRAVSYDVKYDVLGLNLLQRDSLKRLVFKELGLDEEPKTIPEKPTNAVISCAACTGKMYIEVIGTDFNFISTRKFNPKKNKNPLFPLRLRLEPGQYQFKYWQNKVLKTEQVFRVKSDGIINLSID